MSQRRALSTELRRQILAEAGYRCAVPTCRNILALDIHHIVEVSEGGPDAASNLIALCGTCHDLYHRGTYTSDAVLSWKALLVTLNQAFDREAVDSLQFLRAIPPGTLMVSGDGVLKFASLIAAGMATFALKVQNGPLLLYEVTLTQKGRMFVDAWVRGDRTGAERALAPTSP